MKSEIKKTLKDRLEAVHASKWYPSYHISADIGWISDPNGLSFHNGLYHIFHQYTPADDLNLSKAWGHYTTKDWHHFKDEGTLMVPDSWMDKDGCYSGSGYSKDGVLHLYYTGNVLHPGDHDYIYEGRGHYVCHLSSKDGIHFSNKECLLKNEAYPKNMSCHVRDPKLFEWNNETYMVIGARTKDDRGCALLYKTKDLKNFEFVQVIDTKEPFGYMWKCPDIIQLDDKMFLICCPQGVEQNGIDYENIYQNGYFTLTKDEKGLLKAENFKELDKGFDFYAPQSFTDDKGRRILIGWMGIPDADYDNLEKDEKWIHCLSLPRQLTLKNGKINQYPIQEILDLLKNPQSVHLKANQAADLPSSVFALNLNIENKDFILTIRKDVKLVYSHGILSLELGKSGAGRTARHIQTDYLQTLDIFSDHSSLEIFINKGEECFTTRVYEDTKDLKILSDVSLDGTLYEVEPFEIDYSKAL